MRTADSLISKKLHLDKKPNILLLEQAVLFGFDENLSFAQIELSNVCSWKFHSYIPDHFTKITRKY